MYVDALPVTLATVQPGDVPETVKSLGSRPVIGSLKISPNGSVCAPLGSVASRLEHGVGAVWSTAGPVVAAILFATSWRSVANVL